MWRYRYGSPIKSTCYQCTDRHVGCQGTCEKYLAARADYDQKTAEAKKKYMADKDADYFVYESISKYRKRMRK